jgi:Cdc6-like AAA superfamily ATPase
MLLRGSMGAGKTTAICTLIQELRKEHMIVVFILFDTSRPLQQDPSRVLMHFVRQLVDLNDHDQHVLVSGLQQRSSFDRPSADEVVDIFLALIARFTQESKKALCILLDGLDQFKNRDDLDTLLRHVANIQRRTCCGVIATSRFEEICFHSIFKNHIDIQISATYEDAEHIVRSYSPSHHVDNLVTRDASLVNTISRAVMDGSRAL